MNEFLPVQHLTGNLSRIDFIIVCLAVLLLFVISYVSGRREKDTTDFFLGSRKIPAIAASLSFVATEVSALTIVGVPATAYSENWGYLQFFIGFSAAKIAVAFLFIPVFYKHNCTSIYEFLRHRFGPESQYAGSICFFITRLTAAGVRLYAACMGISIIMGWNLSQTLLAFTIISIIFIAFGGIKAVVWAGTYQTAVFFSAGIALLIYLCLHVPAGLSAAWQTASDAGRLNIFKLDLNLNDPTTFWAGSANAFFIGLAAFGTDQELVQRLLTVKTRKESQKTLMLTILTLLPIICVFLAIGTLLYIFFQHHPGVPGPSRVKEVLSYYTANFLPFGLKGLVLSAIILASIDSPLSSLSSSFVTDIYRPLIKRSATEKHYLLISRVGVIVFGVLLAIIAFACEPIENVLWFAFEIFSLTGGAMLGLFLLGVLTNRKTNTGNVAAMIITTLCMAALLLLCHAGYINLAWSWLIVVGTAMMFTLSYVFSLFTTHPARPRI